MNARRAPPFFGLLGCPVAILFIAGVAGVLLFVTLIASLTMMRASAPNDYDAMITEALGVTTVYPNLTVSDTEELRAKGLDPDDVADAIAASNWISKTTGVPGKAGMILATDQLEGRSSSHDAKAAVLANAALKNKEEQTTAISWLLSHWEKYGIHESDPIAAQHIYTGYTGYTGHASAGELPGGFIPSTAKLVCEEGFMPSDDARLQTCNFWDPYVEFHAIAWYMWKIGFDPRRPVSEWPNMLKGWNTRSEWRSKIVDRAVELIELGIEYDLRVNWPFGDIEEIDALRDFTISALDFFGLMPEQVAEARNKALSEIPSGTASDGSISINTKTDSPPGGSTFNIVTWARLNQEIRFEPGETWDICDQTKSTGWSEYVEVFGVNANGICMNASMLYDWAKVTDGMEVVQFFAHPVVPGYPRFTVGISCSSNNAAHANIPLKIRNNTDKVIEAEWVTDGDLLILRTKEEGE